MSDLTEADIDRIEGDGERNFINWLYDAVMKPTGRIPKDRRELYARYLADKPEYITGEDALTRADAESISRAARLYDERATMPRYVSPAGKPLAQILQMDQRRTRNLPEPA